MSSVGALRCRADFCLPLWGEGGVSCSASVSEGSLSPCWDPVSPINSLRNLNLDKNNCQTTYHPAGERKEVLLSYFIEIDSQLSGKVHHKRENSAPILYLPTPTALHNTSTPFYSPTNTNSTLWSPSSSRSNIEAPGRTLHFPNWTATASSWVITITITQIKVLVVRRKEVLWLYLK